MRISVYATIFSAQYVKAYSKRTLRNGSRIGIANMTLRMAQAPQAKPNTIAYSMKRSSARRVTTTRHHCQIWLNIAPLSAPENLFSASSVILLCRKKVTHQRHQLKNSSLASLPTS
jgi:hypothetical protein